MAVDPTQIAEENAQRSALAAQGEPTEFAKDPAQSVQIAGGAAAAIKAINRMRKDPNLPNVPPTPQESVLMPDDGTFSATQNRKVLAPNVLSPEGQAEFEKRGFQATQDENTTVLRSAEDALAEQEAAAAEQTVTDVTQEAQRALTATTRGAAPETALVDEGTADQALDLIATRDAGIKTLTDGGDFNFENLNTGDDVNAAITALAEVYKDPTNAAKRGYLSNEETIANAAIKLEDDIGLQKSILSRKIGQTFNAEQLVAARELLVRSAVKLNDLATKIHNGQGSDLDRLSFRRQMAIHAGIQMQLKGAQVEAARALQSFQIKVGGENSAVRTAQEARRMLAESGGVEMVDDMAVKYLDVYKNEGYKGASAMARTGWRSRTKQMLTESYLAGMLSNTSTQMKNFLGTMSFMLYQLPAEQIAGLYGAVGRKKNMFLYPTVELNPDQVYVNDAALRFKGYMDSFRDALRVGAYAFKTELPAGASKLDVEVYQATTGQSDSYLGKALDVYGKGVRLPFRTLLFADEFFKTMSQRGELYVQANHAYKGALHRGATETEARDEAAMLLLDPYSKADELIDKAKYDTLQSDLGQLSKTMGMVQRFDIAGLPVGRYVMPFATAPTNDMIRSAEFIPFVNLAVPGQAQTLLKVGTREHQMAMGRLSLGSITLASVSLYAAEGKITGAMPSDPKQRDALPPGWQPWSVVYRGENFPKDADGNYLPLYDEYGIPNGKLEYLSYNGFGPVSTLIGIAADTTQRMHMAPDPKDRLNLGSAAALAVMSYYADAPFLEGISNMQAVFDMSGDELRIDATKIFKSPAQTTSLVGVPNPLSSLQNAFDRLFNGGAYTVPREDMEYITEEDILNTTNRDGTLKYANIDGEPDYRYIGQVKSDATSTLIRFVQELDAYQAKGSLAKNARGTNEKNVKRYDTLGRVLGPEDDNIYVRPGRAFFNSFSGFKISETRDITPMEMEIMRISAVTGGWPFAEKRKYNDVKLSPGVRSDWTNQSLNVSEIYKRGVGNVTFIEQLENMTTTTSNKYGREYNRADDATKRQLLIDLRNEFFDKGWEDLMATGRYENLAEVIYNIETAKEEGNLK